MDDETTYAILADALEAVVADLEKQGLVPGAVSIETMHKVQAALRLLRKEETQ